MSGLKVVLAGFIASGFGVTLATVSPVAGATADNIWGAAIGGGGASVVLGAWIRFLILQLEKRDTKIDAIQGARAQDMKDSTAAREALQSRTFELLGQINDVHRDMVSAVEGATGTLRADLTDRIDRLTQDVKALAEALK